MIHKSDKVQLSKQHSNWILAKIRLRDLTLEWEVWARILIYWFYLYYKELKECNNLNNLEQLEKINSTDLLTYLINFFKSNRNIILINNIKK